MVKQKYAILRKGFGEGCDYTIGCNMSWELREFDEEFEEVVEILIKGALYGGDEDGSPEEYARIDDPVIEELIIIPLNNTIVNIIDLKDAVNKHNDIIDGIENKEIEDKEKLEYERLKSKFGGK